MSNYRKNKKKKNFVDDNDLSNPKILEKESESTMNYADGAEDKVIEEDNPIINILGNNTEIQINQHEVCVSRVNSKGAAVKRRYRRGDVQSIQIIGNLKLNSRILRHSGELRIPVVVLSYYMRAVGEFVPVRSVKSEQKAVQMELHISESAIRPKKLDTAKFIVKHAANYRFEILKMFLDEAALGKDKEYYLSLVDRIDSAGDEEVLRGIEGSLMNLYFSFWDKMLLTESFEQRSRQPPKNPPNAALSYLNMQLYSRCEQEVIRCLLDPWFGCLHELQFNRASFGIDIAEVYRPLLVDLVILRFFRQKILNRNCFEIKPDYCLLNEQGRTLMDSHFSYLLDCPVVFSNDTYPSSIRKIIRKQIEAIYAFWRDPSNQKEPKFYNLLELNVKLYGKRNRNSKASDAAGNAEDRVDIPFLSVIGVVNASSDSEHSVKKESVIANNNKAEEDHDVNNKIDLTGESEQSLDSPPISVEDLLTAYEELKVHQFEYDLKINHENEDAMQETDMVSTALLNPSDYDSEQSQSTEILTEEDLKDIDLLIDTELEHLDISYYDSQELLLNEMNQIDSMTKIGKECIMEQRSSEDKLDGGNYSIIPQKIHSSGEEDQPTTENDLANEYSSYNNAPLDKKPISAALRDEPDRNPKLDSAALRDEPDRNPKLDSVALSDELDCNPKLDSVALSDELDCNPKLDSVALSDELDRNPKLDSVALSDELDRNPKLDSARKIPNKFFEKKKVLDSVEENDFSHKIFESNNHATRNELKDIKNEVEEPEFYYLSQAKSDKEVYRCFLKDILRHDKLVSAKNKNKIGKLSSFDVTGPKNSPKEAMPSIIPFDHLLNDEQNAASSTDIQPLVHKEVVVSVEDPSFPPKSDEQPMKTDKPMKSAKELPQNSSTPCDTRTAEGSGKTIKEQLDCMHDHRLLSDPRNTASSFSCSENRELKKYTLFDSVKPNTNSQRRANLQLSGSAAMNENVEGPESHNRCDAVHSKHPSEKPKNANRGLIFSQENNEQLTEKQRLVKIIAEQIMSLQPIIGTKKFEFLEFTNMIYRELCIIQDMIENHEVS